MILLHTWEEGLNSNTDQVILWDQRSWGVFLDDIEIKSASQFWIGL